MRSQRGLSFLRRIIIFSAAVMSIVGLATARPVTNAVELPLNGNAEDWYNYITQFADGFATATIDSYDVSDFPNNMWLIILIKQSPENDFDGYYIQYRLTSNEHYVYFEEDLADVITYWVIYARDYSFEYAFEQYYAGEGEYNGIIYWNFEEEYWQIKPYGISEKEVDMVTDLLDTLAEIGAGIGDLFGKIVESVGQFFYTPGTGDTPGQFTIIGILTIAAVVVSLSMWVLRLILRLFKLRG